MTTRKRTKFDTPATPGSYDWILRDIRDAVARATPPPPPTPPADPPRPPRVHVAVEITQRKPPTKPNSGLWGVVGMLWLMIAAIVVMALLTGALKL